ncbi:MAG TPA: hypothetical protein VGR43_02355 [Dehalococcoidia bacterium]|nr:hypothetical protein [Dehalococcoidia bacterium]
MADKKKIAAIVTSYHPRSHADVIVTKFMKGFPTDLHGRLEPQLELASLYLDQIHERDIGLGFAAEHGVPVFPSIRSALTLGGKELAVDGVLLVGEHGDYAYDEQGRHLYPRRHLMEQTCGVFASSGRSVPVFSDKHLSYNWTDAKWMYDRARQLKAPFMAGSSLPTCWRDPWLEHDLETPIEAAVGIGYGGLESYGFHALETLQCMVERRRGGETGVAAVQCLEGNAVWEAGKDGRWSRELATAACAPMEGKPEGSFEQGCQSPAAFLIEYRDGLQAAVLMLNNYVHGFGYAARVNGEARGTAFVLQNGEPFGHFSYLSLNIQEMFLTGRPTYPVERTLLTTGILDAVMESRARGYQRVETPHLAIAERSYEELRGRAPGSKPAGAMLDPWPTEPGAPKG